MHRYGVGMAVGFTAVLILKKAIRGLPVVGGIAKPILGERQIRIRVDGYHSLAAEDFQDEA
jgi:Na+-translocating ferredoxin:NAD+ oxidoreductase RnfA subunit